LVIFKEYLDVELIFLALTLRYKLWWNSFSPFWVLISGRVFRNHLCQRLEAMFGLWPFQAVIPKSGMEMFWYSMQLFLNDVCVLVCKMYLLKCLILTKDESDYKLTWESDEKLPCGMGRHEMICRRNYWKTVWSKPLSLIVMMRSWTKFVLKISCQNNILLNFGVLTS